MSCLQFRNKAREKQRQLTLKQRGDTPVGKCGREQAAPAGCPQQPMQKKLPAAKRRRIETQEDDAALVEDYRHLKKLKNGQITQVNVRLFVRLPAALWCWEEEGIDMDVVTCVPCGKGLHV